ncbi:MAG: ribonuclease HII [Clostridia bacterium]|nr:ribonuclease HII [Clostridia bacterium]
MLLYDIEEALENKGFNLICGVDEAGRGPLAGDVYAAAVILPKGLIIDGLDDSKKLSEKKREALFDVITENAVAYGIASATPRQIDEMNILNAVMYAMNEAVKKLSPSADYALIDGNIARGFSIPCETVIKGDAKSPSIAAASILAKVSRDRECYVLDEKYPEYGFAKHKGYGTKAHMEALFKYGPCPVHRRTFLKFLNDDK